MVAPRANGQLMERRVIQTFVSPTDLDFAE